MVGRGVVGCQSSQAWESDAIRAISLISMNFGTRDQVFVVALYCLVRLLRFFAMTGTFFGYERGRCPEIPVDEIQIGLSPNRINCSHQH